VQSRFNTLPDRKARGSGSSSSSSIVTFEYNDEVRNTCLGQRTCTTCEDISTSQGAFTDPPDGVLSKKHSPREDDWLQPSGFGSLLGRAARLFFKRECTLRSEKSQWCGVFSCSSCSLKYPDAPPNYFCVPSSKGLWNLNTHAKSCNSLFQYTSQMEKGEKLHAMKGERAMKAMKELMATTFCIVSQRSTGPSKLNLIFLTRRILILHWPFQLSRTKKSLPCMD
jgi:hypothetical protein